MNGPMRILLWDPVCTFGEMTIAFFRFPKGYVTPDRERITELGYKRESC